ncbi:MAG: hypothetical protein PHW55_08245 [Methanothrix sp.]|jgi:hypothetical protein|uniref:Uncharacterized protein n=1 Tax=Methanothrix harundinacea TaxID=301375 RepID=A0A101IJB4_9EURY|nr:MAG: hypothetical protein APR56_06310 [Methanosaeta sp. SDB]KUK44816.1 MAG: Uncharacterized protein XD72_0776 [Methanothrix harundinacea]KUK96301.1 MAG: Uncharacterized protein XE07_1238 [Methanothrix harundinacea]MDD5768558.1 hypothetical protein [Methanothrix sp.]MDI9398382.1 hypothetical protein [Euryarchaeota archaeon]
MQANYRAWPFGADHPWPPGGADQSDNQTAGIGEILLMKENYKFADMKTKELIIREIEVFPEPYLKEVLDLVRF